VFLLQSIGDAELCSTISGGDQQERVDGRRLELESITGAIVQAGREVSVTTPMNAAIYAALKPYAEGAPSLP